MPKLFSGYRSLQTVAGLSWHNVSVHKHELQAKRLLELQDLLFKFSEVERQIFFPDGKKQDRKENDAEHSYSLAMAAWFLGSHFPHLDQHKLIKYALAHDFVEVHAGDEMAIGRSPEAEKVKHQREKEALERLEVEWADFSDLIDTIKNYELRVDREAKFVYALDKIMPILLNLLSDGKTWKTYKLAKKDVIDNKDKTTQASPEINELWSVFKEQIMENPDYFAHEEFYQEKTNG